MVAVKAEPLTRADLTECITHLAATAARMPDHWADRRAAIHRDINEKLDLLERMG